jgi:hypothetical protein
MNRQDFNTQIKDEFLKLESSIADGVQKFGYFKYGADAAYNLLSKEISENNVQLKQLLDNNQFYRIAYDNLLRDFNFKSKEISEKDDRLEVLGNELSRLKGLLYEVCVRANIIFPETEPALGWFEEKFIHQHSLFAEIAEILHLGENDEFTIKDNQL